jgi:hypothetical protein
MLSCRFIFSFSSRSCSSTKAIHLRRSQLLQSLLSDPSHPGVWGDAIPCHASLPAISSKSCEVHINIPRCLLRMAIRAQIPFGTRALLPETANLRLVVIRHVCARRRRSPTAKPRLLVDVAVAVIRGVVGAGVFPLIVRVEGEWGLRSGIGNLQRLHDSGDVGGKGLRLRLLLDLRWGLLDVFHLVDDCQDAAEVGLRGCGGLEWLLLA